MNKETIVAINNLNKKYSYDIKFFNETIYITSKNGEWYFYFNEKNEAVLYHKNKKYNTERYHYQRKFANIYHMFDRINQHDTPSVMFRKPKKMQRLEVLFNSIQK